MHLLQCYVPDGLNITSFALAKFFFGKQNYNNN